MKRVFFLLALVSLLLSGCCTDYKRLQVNSYKIDGLERLSMMKGKVGSIMRLSLDVSNPTGSRYTIKSVKATFYRANGDVFAVANSTKESVINPHSTGFLPVEFDVTLHQPMTMLFSKVDYNALIVDFDISAKSGWFPVSISRRDMPVRDLIEKFGAPK